MGQDITTAQALWTLQGITEGSDACEHCGRTLSRLFRVTSPEGTEMVVGRVCSRKLTGYSWTVALAERVERSRLRDERAAATYGELWTEARRVAAATASLPGIETAGIAGDALEGMRQGVEREWAEMVLAKAQAFLARY